MPEYSIHNQLNNALFKKNRETFKCLCPKILSEQIYFIFLHSFSVIDFRKSGKFVLFEIIIIKKLK